MTTERTEHPLPMYVSYSTFTTFLDWLGDMDVIPSRIDRSLWTGKFAGGTGSQLVVGLRFLGLLDGEKPTEHLEPLARADTAQRKELMGQLLRDIYGTKIIDELQRMTPKMLEDHLSELGATDATRRKALAFLVNAAKAADIRMAPAISKKTRRRRKSTTSVRAKARGQEEKPKDKKKKPEDQSASAINTRTVKLKSGGQVSVMIDIDLFALSEDDRKFVLSLVDRLRTYEGAQDRLDEAAAGKNEEAPGPPDLAATPGASEGDSHEVQPHELGTS